MELVYLWVEDYKNIKKQGFNFSPRFNCDFDGETLRIDEKKEDEYIKDFFGDNINVTAIVGKNGSGKSSVLECLIEFIHNILHGIKVEKMEAFKKNRNVVFIFYNKRFNEFLIFKNFEIKLINNININIENQKILNSFVQNFFILHYDYSFNRLEHTTALGAYGEDDKVPLLCLPNKNIDILSDTNSDKIIIARHLIVKQHIGSSKYFEPTSIYIKNKNLNSIDETQPSIIKKIESNINSIDKTQLSIIEKIEFDIYRYIVNLTIEKVRNLIDLKLLSKISNFEGLKEFITSHNQKLIEQFYLPNGGEHAFHVTSMKKALKYLEVLEKYGSKKLFEFDELYGSFKVDIQFLQEKNINLLTELPLDCFKIIIRDQQGKEYDSLSSGEKSALRMRYYIENIIISQKKDNYLILLDEPSNDWHPEWQKNLLSYLIDIFKDRKQNVQFILTSHSPFLLSDIPKENVIFLDTYKKEKTEKKYPKLKLSEDIENGYCINVSKEINLNIFGQNIHTLLSDGFFMDDGLMGEFAKNKIQEIMDFLNDEKTIEEVSTKEEQIKQVIESIGEPFLKEKLLSMYNEKYPKSKEEKIAELEAEIQRLKTHG